MGLDWIFHGNDRLAPHITIGDGSRPDLVSALRARRLMSSRSMRLASMGLGWGTYIGASIIGQVLVGDNRRCSHRVRDGHTGRWVATASCVRVRAYRYAGGGR